MCFFLWNGKYHLFQEYHSWKSILKSKGMTFKFSYMYIYILLEIWPLCRAPQTYVHAINWICIFVWFFVWFHILCFMNIVWLQILFEVKATNCCFWKFIFFGKFHYWMSTTLFNHILSTFIGYISISKYISFC